jgi:ABC-type nitrate/sulfonate/bicarbonate transport system permease component
MVLGFLLGALTGIAAGVLLARWDVVFKIIDPFLVALNSIPRMALAPLLIIWFGIDMTSKVVLAGTLVFFILFLTRSAGFGQWMSGCAMWLVWSVPANGRYSGRSCCRPPPVGS